MHSEQSLLGLNMRQKTVSFRDDNGAERPVGSLLTAPSTWPNRTSSRLGRGKHPCLATLTGKAQLFGLDEASPEHCASTTAFKLLTLSSTMSRLLLQVLHLCSPCRERRCRSDACWSEIPCELAAQYGVGKILATAPLLVHSKGLGPRRGVDPARRMHSPPYPSRRPLLPQARVPSQTAHGPHAAIVPLQPK